MSSRTAPAALSVAPLATRRLRLERLIGTDETKGVRGDLGRALRSKAAGFTTWVDGQPIDEAITRHEDALSSYQRLLDALANETEAAS